MLSKSGKIRLPCLLPDLRRNAFSFSPLSMMLAMSLSYMAFIMLRYVLSLPTFTFNVLTSYFTSSSFVYFLTAYHKYGCFCHFCVFKVFTSFISGWSTTFALYFTLPLNFCSFCKYHISNFGLVFST